MARIFWNLIGLVKGFILALLTVLAAWGVTLTWAMVKRPGDYKRLFTHFEKERSRK